MRKTIDLRPSHEQLALHTLSEEEEITRLRHYDLLARQNPQKYRLYVWAAVTLGWFYIALMITLGTTGVVSGIWLLIYERKAVIGIKLIILCGVMLGFLQHGFKKAKSADPSGYILDRTNAKQVFDCLEEIFVKIGKVKIDTVLVDGSCNAYVSVRRKFLIGPVKRFLVIGLPLVFYLNPTELKTLLGHEVGHFSPTLTRLHRACYGVRDFWLRIYAKLLEQPDALISSRWFFRRYIPWLDRLTTSYSRQCEYACDDIAATVTGSIEAAQLLLKIEAIYQLYNKRLHEVYQKYGEQALPSPFYAQLTNTELPSLSECDLQQMVTKLGEEKEDIRSSHPTLTSRIKAQGSDLFQLPLPVLVPGGVLEAVTLTAITQYLDQEWLSNTSDGWKEEYDLHQQSKERYQEFYKKSMEATLPEDESVMLIHLAKYYETEKGKYIEILKQHTARWPDETYGMFLTAELLHDNRSFILLDQIISLDEHRTPAVAQLGSNIAESIKDTKKQEYFSKMLDDYYQKQQTIHQEALLIHSKATFIPTRLKGPEIQAVKKDVQARKAIAKAYLIDMVA